MINQIDKDVKTVVEEFEIELSKFNPATVPTTHTNEFLDKLKHYTTIIVPLLPEALQKQFNMLSNREIFSPGTHVSPAARNMLHTMIFIQNSNGELTMKKTVDLMKTVATYRFDTRYMRELNK